MREEEAKRKNAEAEVEAICAASNALMMYTKAIKGNLAKLIASLCNEDVDEMLNAPKNIKLVQSRWLYWYSLKHLYGETGESISRGIHDHYQYKTSSIIQGISKMSMLIQKNTIWTKRWYIVKRVMDATTKIEQTDMFEPIVKVKITRPNGVRVEFKEE